MKKEVMSSETEKYIKYRRIELLSFIIVVAGLIIAALSALFEYKGDKYYVGMVTLITIGLVIFACGAILFIVFYFKIKKLNGK